MILSSIKLKNFRQYKKEIEISFSEPINNKNITLIIAANGVGKTTLLQAIRYCFYGSSSNYLNLPNAKELINNKLVDELKELDKTNMFVEVTFSHKGEKYIAKREVQYEKNKGKMRPISKEVFSLNYLTATDGYKPFDDESKSIDKIKSIMPDGLSQVFMFDGERMERNISDREFSNELKESILAILDLKKYDKLIKILGSEGRLNSVIGMLNNRKQTSSPKERSSKEHSDKAKEKIEKLNDEISDIESKIKSLRKEIDLKKDEQEQIDQIDKLSLKRSRLERDVQRIEGELKIKAEQYLAQSKKAIVYKLLLQNKDSYDNYISKYQSDKEFYEYLHMNTIEDILEKEKCLCGHIIEKGSPEEERLVNLKKYSLPLESAQYLNFIKQKFKKAVEFSDVFNKLEVLKEKIRKDKSEMRDKKSEADLIEKDILKIEKKLGISNQEDIENTRLKIENLLVTQGKLEKEREDYINLDKKLQKEVIMIDGKSKYNKKINNVITILKSVKSKLETKKNNLDKKARETLAKNFDMILNNTIHGKYSVSILPDYSIEIEDLRTNKDVTTSLSTGQNVIVSLSFIKALILTAKEKSKVVDKDEKYGVIMDAALSNLDEIHIERLCRYNLRTIDQLIFLSFKRQLRDEMYNGIKENIGKAYLLKINDQGYIEKEQLNLEQLDYIIHENGDDENV